MAQTMDKGPTTANERYVILDALRGLALLGIALANFPEFALWTFLSTDEQQAMATAGIDRVVRCNICWWTGSSTPSPRYCLAWVSR